MRTYLWALDLAPLALPPDFPPVILMDLDGLVDVGDGFVVLVMEIGVDSRCVAGDVCGQEEKKVFANWEVRRL